MPKKGPARIRIQLSRQLRYAEREYLKQLSVAIEEIFPGAGKYLGRIRLSASDRLYAEAYGLSSRKLYEGVADFLEDNFVNLFPKAVKTFREVG